VGAEQHHERATQQLPVVGWFHMHWLGHVDVGCGVSMWQE